MYVLVVVGATMRFEAHKSHLVIAHEMIRLIRVKFVAKHPPFCWHPSASNQSLQDDYECVTHNVLLHDRISLFIFFSIN